MKKMIASVIAIAMIIPMVALPASANNSNEGIMLCEDFGTCPKGHDKPSGYTLDDYYTEESEASLTGVQAGSIVAFMIPGFADDLIVVCGLTELGLLFGEDLLNKNQAEIIRHVYEYRKGNSRYYHIIYSEPFDAAVGYKYITCETFYG